MSQQQSSGDTVELSGQNGNSSRKSRWQGFKNFFSNLFNGFSSCRSSSEASGGSRESEENIDINDVEGANTVASEIQKRSESAELSKEAQNTKIIDKTKSTSSQKKHVEEPQPCFQTNKEIEIFTSDELNYNTINNPNINHPLKEIIKKTSNEQVSANKPESDEENHNPELQVNLNQIEKNNNPNDDARLKEIEQSLKASEPSSIEQSLEEPVAQPVVQEVPIEESQVETEPTSVSEPEVQSVVQEKLAEKPKEAQNTKIIDKTKSTSSQKKHVEEPQPCFQTNKEIEIFTSDELNYNTINNPNINHPLKEIIKKTSNEQVSANKPESDEENHNPELQVNLKQIEKNNNSNDDAQLKEIEQSLKSSEPLSVEQPLEEPVAQPVVQEVPIKEPQVEAEPTSVPDPETQEITYDGLCKMIENSSLQNETKSNLKDSLKSKPINVEDIKEIISAVGAKTLQKEHNLMCSLLKFLINKGIDSEEQLFRFKDLIDHLIKNSVLTPNDHSIVFGALNILGNNSDTQSWRLAAIAIEKKLLTGEEQRTYCTTTVESIMGSNNFQSSILKMLFFNGSQERINLKNNILSSIINHEKLSDQQLLCIVQKVDDFILKASDDDDDDAINNIRNIIAKDGILTKLLNIIKNTKPKETIIYNFASILYNIMQWMATKKDEYSDDIGSLKESLKDLLLTFKPTLESYNSRACGMTMSDETQDPLWTYVLAMEAQNIGIDMSQSVEKPPVEAKSTSVSEAEAQEITYDALCEMVEKSSSLAKETKSNLKNSLNSKSIKVKDIQEIILAFAPETLKNEHDLVCSILKFLMNKVIDAGQRLEFRGLINTLIDKEVLQKQDHNLVYESLVGISNQIQSTDSSVIIKIANSAIQQSILNQEECVGIISNSVMNAKFYDRIIANIASQNTILSHVIAKNVIQQISPEKLFNVISTVGDNLKNINNIHNTNKKASVTNWFVTEFLPTLLQRIQTLVANNSVNEEVKKNILFQFSCLFDGAILNNLFAQNKSAAAKLFNSLVPYLNQYQLNASQTQSWIGHLKEEAEKYGITLQKTV